MLHQEFSELQREFDQFREVIKEQEDPIVLRMALDQSRRDLAKTQNLLNDFNYGFETVVPKSQ